MTKYKNYPGCILLSVIGRAACQLGASDIPSQSNNPLRLLSLAIFSPFNRWPKSLRDKLAGSTGYLKNPGTIVTYRGFWP